MLRNNEIESMLKEGYTRKFALYYLETLEKEKSMTCFNQDFVRWAHSHGFFAESAYCYNLNSNNVDDYLSDYDFYKAWPLDDWTRIWINDKLTLKLLLANTRYDSFMPMYYYYTSSHGLKSLIDNDNDSNLESFIKTLRNVGEFACKPCNGSTSLGFFKMSYQKGNIIVGNRNLKESQLADFLKEHKNYLFTEYIRPSKQFERISQSIHTLRIVTINTDGDNPKIVGGYFRMPNSNNGEANYSVLNGRDTEKYNIFVEIDIETGRYFNAKKTYINRIENIVRHPESNEPLTGTIDNFIELKNTILEIARRFCTLEYLGFDIGITDSGFKCMEINSLPGHKYMQIFKPFKKCPPIADFFNRKLYEIEMLTEKEKRARCQIIR